MNSLKKTVFAVMMLSALGISSKAMAGAAFTLNPSLATAGSTEVVEVIGSGTTFAGATAALTTVGGTPVTNLLVVDSTHIVMTVPAKTKGAYTISVNATVGGPYVVANAITYTQANRTLQVSMNVVIAKNCSIAWASGTSNDDIPLTTQGGSQHGTTGANSISPYTWWLRDAEFGLSGVANATINLAAVYSTDGTGNSNGDGFAADPTNAHTILVTTSTLTGSFVQVDAITSDDVPSPAGIIWTAAGAAGNNQYLVQACLGTVAQGSAGTKPLLVSPVANLIPINKPATANMPLNLQVSTPLVSTSPVTTQHTITVSLIATAN